jgi:translocation and assembly module TamB
MSRFRSLSIKKTILLGLPALVILVVLVLSGSTYWLLNTSSGASWLWHKLEALEVADVRSSRVSGDLASGFVIDDMEYRSTDLDLLIRHTEIEVSIDWWPMSIQVSRLSLQDLEILMRTPSDTTDIANEEADIRTTLGDLELPLPLEIKSAVLTNISLQQDDELPVTLVESVSFQAALDEELVVDYLDVLAAGLDTRLQGYLKLQPPFELAASLQGVFERSGEADSSLITMPFKLETSGNLDSVTLSLASDKFGLKLQGEILEPASSPVWNIEAAMDHQQWPEVTSGQGVELTDLKLASQGFINDWSFMLDSGVQLDGLQNGRLAISGSGSATGVEIGEANFTGNGVDLTLSGNLDWSTKPEAGLKAIIRQLDLSPWLPEWPAGEKLVGDMELNWSEDGLQIPVSQLSVSGSSLVVGIEADIDIEANSVSARLDWKKLGWPLKDASADFFSESGQMSISGTADDWVVNGQLDVRVGDYPQGRFELQGGGDRNSMHLLIPRGEILGGSLSGKTNADWSQDLNWEAAILANGVDPEPFLTGWPGRLDLEIEISAQGQSKQTQINLVALQGLLREVPISARGGLLVEDTNLTFRSFEFRTNDAVLELNGAMAQPEGMKVAFSGDLPSELLGGAKGNLQLEGRYSSDSNHPLMMFQLRGSDFAWNGIGIKNLVISAPESDITGPLPPMQLDATGVVWNDVLLDELSLAFSPVGEQYELKADIESEDLVFNGLINLVPENADDLLQGPWHGVISGLEVIVGPAYTFVLSEPADFAWSSGSASLGPLCLSENLAATLCIGLDYQSNGDWSLVADATAIPVNYARDILELDMHFEQLLEGRLEWHQPQEGPPTGGADFRITAGQILDLLDNELLARTNEGRFAFALQNGNLESGTLDIELPGTGFIDVDFEVLDIVVDGLQEVQGRALARLDQFKLLGQLTLPGVDAIDGQFESNIRLGGNLSDPVFEGAFKFSNGFIHYLPIGLELEDIEFEGQVTNPDQGNFKGKFRAGEGIASLDGSFQFADLENVKLDIALAGENLLLVNTDELKILTNADVRVALGPQRMDINGKITVPSASLTPANLLLGEVRDSEDLVIEGSEVEADPVTADSSGKSPVYGQLEVTLGDDVVVKVPGIQTRISGSTLFNWNGAPVPMAQGGYTITGTVDIYGPKLNIRKGNVSFPGVPADNPLLNIRAGRDIYGNTQIRRAGVQVIGSLKRPVLEAYTVPITNEDRAWALLITGSDFDQGQGVNGFDVGTYIAPKLYISYGISLFEDENVISARYDLKKGFGVKVTSGQRETGLDVSYTIDR